MYVRLGFRSRARPRVGASLVRAVALAVVLVGVVGAWAAPGASAASSPVGTVAAYGGTSLPAGWLWADGAAVNRTTYADLFAVTGTAYGAGDGSTTFNVPDMRQRFALGTAPSGTGSTRGQSGGAIDHTHGTAAHGHGIASGGGHQHTVNAHDHRYVLPVGLSSGAFSFPMMDDPALDLFGRYDFYDVVSAQINCCYGTIFGGTEHWVGTSSSNSALTSTIGAHDHGGAGSSSPATGTANPPFLTTNYIVKADGAASDPCGMVWGTGRSSAPAGAVLADGAALGRASQATLFGCLGTTFGVGDGSTTFNVPDLRGRFPLGKASSGTGSTLGGAGGAIDHTHSVASHSHSIASAGGGAHTTLAHNHQFHSPVGLNSNRISYIRPDDPVLDGLGVTNVWTVTSTNIWCCPASFGDIVELWRINTSTAAPNTDSQGATNHGGSTGATSPSTVAANPPFQSINYAMDTTGGAQARVGTIMPYAGSTPPPGWKLADGATLSRSSFADLFAATGTAFGAGDGSTTFRIPDLRQRFALGRATAGTGSTLGGTGGTIDHAPAVAGHTHSIGSAGGHAHTVGAHAHQFISPIGKSGANFGAFNITDPALNAVGSYSWEAVVGAGVHAYYGTGVGWLERHLVTTTSETVGTSTGGAHDHGGATASTGPATSATNPPWLSMPSIVAVDLDGPGVPTLVAPADGVSRTASPQLTATYLDTVTSTHGSLEFQVCSDAACSAVVTGGSSAAGLTTGSNGSWTPGALATGTYHWRARGRDGGDNVSAWSATRQFTIEYLIVSVSTLGHGDVARDSSPPYAIAFASALPGVASEIGPAGSGQRTPGAAIEVALDSSGGYDVLASSTDWNGPGGSVMPAGAMSWRRAATLDPWTPFTTTDGTLEGAGVAGVATHRFDLRVVVPPGQRAGAFSSTLVLTAVASP